MLSELKITLLGFAFRVSDDDAVQTKPYLQIPLQCFNQSGCGNRNFDMENLDASIV